MDLKQLDYYQFQADRTAIYPGKYNKEGLAYASLGLVGEAGEVANKVKKILRGDITLEESVKDLESELGDVLWYVAAVAENLNLNLSTIAKANLEKLASREERNVIKGSGDNR